MAIAGRCRALTFIDHGIFLDQLPTNAIGLGKGLHGLLMSVTRQRLVAFIRFRIRICILKDTQSAVRPNPSPNDVCFLTALKFIKAQLRLHPMDTVAAFGVTNRLGIIDPWLLLEPGTIIHTLEILVA